MKQELRDRANAHFKTPDELRSWQARATAERQAAVRRADENTARLRALRLARDSAEAEADAAAERKGPRKRS